MPEQIWHLFQHAPMAWKVILAYSALVVSTCTLDLALRIVERTALFCLKAYTELRNFRSDTWPHLRATLISAIPETRSGRGDLAFGGLIGVSTVIAIGLMITGDLAAGIGLTLAGFWTSYGILLGALAAEAAIVMFFPPARQCFARVKAWVDAGIPDRDPPPVDPDGD